MLPTARLTKRQKKGIAFRERKRNQGKDKAPGITGDLEDEIDVPGLEDQVIVTATQGQQGSQVSTKTCVGKGKTGGSWDSEERLVAATKRKKASEEAKGSLERKPKRRKGSNGSPLDDMEELVDDLDHDGEGEAGESRESKQRFILFLGNLKYTTTPEAIQAHFSACDPPPTVRLLTPKSKSFAKSLVTKSKGCAFLEFKHRAALQQALKLHHSAIDGRQINVELTAGGGGKGLTRMEKVKERNKELEGQRRKRQGPGMDTQTCNGAQRFSATAGMEQIHVRKRTWTVGDVGGKGTKRGGQGRQKGSKKRRSLALDFRTGVNAIPVG